VCASPARAQWVVIDPANLAQAILIAERAWRHYDELQRQYRTILRMGEGLGSMEQYRTPPIALTRHDVGRWDYGRPWIQGLNSGDATGEAYRATTLPVLRPTVMPSGLSLSARRTLERQYATIEITDSVASMGGHQVALARGYHGRLQDAVQALEGDVLNGLLRYHEMTAILDKIAAGELLGRRQDMLSNQLLSHALEQLLARSKRLRDTEAATMNMQLRHIHSTLLNDLKVPVKIAQEQLGHASIQTTLNIYTHVVDASHRKAIEAVERELFPSVPKSARQRRTGK
jgi:Phage integrase family/Domain of unknown function (DUF4141)